MEEENPINLLDAQPTPLYGSKEWDERFEALTDLFSHENYWIWTRAIDRLITLLKDEKKQHIDKFQVLAERIENTFQAIAIKALNRPEVFAYFCLEFNWIVEYPLDHNLVLEWLDQLATRVNYQQTPEVNAILAAKIFFGVYNSTWQEAGAILLELLDHHDLYVRACAAYQIGKFCQMLFCMWEPEEDYIENGEIKNHVENEYPNGSYVEGNSKDDHYIEEGLDNDSPEGVLHNFREEIVVGNRKWVFQPGVYEDYETAVMGMPGFEEIMQLMKAEEIKRPGIAGAWYWSFYISNKWPDPTNIDVREWLLSALEESPEPEPYISYFSCTLGFWAHEWCSTDPDAIRRLIDMGRPDIAVAAATDLHCRIEAFEPLLIELGNNYDAPEIIRLASWQLAYHYHYFHPRGAEHGFVELIGGLPEIDLFLLFSRRREVESPYAVVMYPKERGQKLRGDVAQKWLNRILPESGGAYVYYIEGEEQQRLTEPSDLIDKVEIAYRSNGSWNPKQLL